MGGLSIEFWDELSCVDMSLIIILVASFVTKVKKIPTQILENQRFLCSKGMTTFSNTCCLKKHRLIMKIMSTVWLHKQAILIVAFGRQVSAYYILNHLEKCIPWLFFHWMKYCLKQRKQFYFLICFWCVFRALLFILQCQSNCMLFISLYFGNTA